MNLLAWSLLLIIQNAAFTWVSRARNGGSYGYHAVAATFSNGIWFVSQFLLISMVTFEGMSIWRAVLLGVVYTLSTVVGSVLMHWFSVRFLERGKRKVGA